MPHPSPSTYDTLVDLPARILHPLSDRPGPDLVLSYATDSKGKSVGWDLNSSSAHALVAGAAGSGKTTCLRTITVAATAKGCEVWIADPASMGLASLREWPGIGRYSSTIDQIAQLIADAHELMHARYEALETAQARRAEFTPLVVILDDYPLIRSRIGDADAAMLHDLVVLSRVARIHLCFGVQRPDAALFDKGGRDSIRHRISLGVLSPEGAMMMWNNARIGTEVDMSVAGRATAVGSDGTADDVQTWWTPDPQSGAVDEAAVMSALRERSRVAQQRRGDVVVR